MSTKVTVDAHAGWPVKVEAIDTFTGDTKPKILELAIVEAFDVRDFHVWDTRILRITEMPKS